MTTALSCDVQASDAEWAYARMLWDFHLAPSNLFERLAFAAFDAEREVRRG